LSETTDPRDPRDEHDEDQAEDEQERRQQDGPPRDRQIKKPRRNRGA
jgi:hypothetical protein